MEDTKYKNIGKETIIFEKTVLQSIEEAKNSAIKHIMRIVDNNVNGEPHKNIRSVVLDEVNDMKREFADILERAYKN